MLVLFDGLLLVVSVVGIAWGGTSERIGVAIVIAATGMSNIVGSLAGRDWLGRRPELMVIELVTFAAFLALAGRSRSFWPLWASGMQLASVITQIAAIGLPPSAWQAYALVQGVWAYPILIALLCGSVRRRRLVARYGPNWVLELWRQEETRRGATDRRNGRQPQIDHRASIDGVGSADR